MILLTNSQRIPFQIDDEFADIVSQHTWNLADGYVVTAIPKNIPGEPRQKTTAVHILLFGPAAPGMVWDHRNRNRLDNRRENLRQVSSTVNARNKSVQRNSTTGVRGVYINFGRGKKYRVQIMANRKLIQIGMFDNIEQAILARKKAEEFYWGDEK